MQLDSYLMDALERVLARDLPDEACADAVAAEACLLAGLEPEQPCSGDED